MRQDVGRCHKSISMEEKQQEAWVKRGVGSWSDELSPCCSQGTRKYTQRP